MFYNLKIKYLKNMKKYAIQENIRIIPEETGIFLENFINTKKIVDILEIGTAVGYSALTMMKLILPKEFRPDLGLLLALVEFHQFPPSLLGHLKLVCLMVSFPSRSTFL
ncbi:MAG: hypothetical protein Q8842_02210, partial [Candidatus Phytoplasma australasiaticum]|nr:hypothetical protein [Candidatus Phytoplasma australasiaticum]